MRMAHDCTNGQPCCYKDGHIGQHRTKRDADYDRRWNRTGGVLAARRYRARNPVKRALTLVKFQEKGMDDREA